MRNIPGVAQLLMFCMGVLQAIFNTAQGPECIFLWRAIGAALVSIVPTASYSLKVLHIPLLANAASDWHDVEDGVISTFLIIAMPQGVLS